MTETVFPAALDAATDPLPTTSQLELSHAQQHARTNDAIAALQAKVGIDNSLDPNSIDYKLAQTTGIGVDNDVAKGAALVGFTCPLDTVPQGPNYLKTVSDIINGLPVSIARFIDKTRHAAMRDGTTTYNASTDINDAFANYNNFYLPPWTFGVGATLLLPDRLCMRGAGWTMPYNGGVSAPRGSVFKLLNSANCDVFRQAGKATRYGFHLANFAVDGNGNNQGDVGNTPDGTYNMYQFNRNAFFLEALYNAVFDRLAWYNVRGAGMAIHGDAGVGCTNIFINNCHGYNARTYNIYTEGATTDMRINGGDYGFGRVANLRLTSSNTVVGATFWTSQCQDITNANTHASGTGPITNAGITIAGDNNKLEAFRSEGNAGHGVRIVGNNNRLSNGALYFNSATASSAGLFDGIYDTGDDNVFEAMDIRQAASTAYGLRKAITLGSGHSGTRIRGGSMRNVGASATAMDAPVGGFSWALGDRSDFSWATGYVSASCGVAHSIGTSATKVQFRTESADVRGEWSITNDEFTALEAGVYRFDVGVGINNATDGNKFTMGLYKNGVEARRLGQMYAGAAQPVQLNATYEVKLEAGDVVDIRATAGTATNTLTGVALTWIEVSQVNG